MLTPGDSVETDNAPVPVMADEIAIFELVIIDKLLAPKFCAPENWIIPLSERSKRLSFHVAARISIRAVLVARPKIIWDHPLVIFPKSVAVSFRVPTDAVPIPNDCESVAVDIDNVPDPDKAALA